MEHIPPPRRMADYVWFRIPGRVPNLPAPFFLGHGVATRAGYRTDRVRQESLPGKMVLSLALTEGGQACIQGRVQSLKRGHAMFHEVHDRMNWFGMHPQHHDRFEYLGLIFDGQIALDMVAAIRERFAGPYLIEPHAPMIRRLLALTQERSHFVSVSATQSLILMSEVLAHVLHAAEGEVHTPQTKQLAQTAEAIMSDQPAVEWTVAELAHRCGVSREHLTRAFTLKYGVPPRRYLSELRMQRACSQLRGTDTPIKNIMLELGFTSYATFTRAFRRYTNATPTEYRENRSL